MKHTVAGEALDEAQKALDATLAAYLKGTASTDETSKD